MTFWQNLTSHLNLIPALVRAVQEFQDIGHTKESAVAKVVQIVKTCATLGEQIPVPQVAAISAIVEGIAEQVFAPPPTLVFSAPPTPPTPQPAAPPA
jgi:hypothetical protein